MDNTIDPEPTVPFRGRCFVAARIRPSEDGAAEPCAVSVARDGRAVAASGLKNGGAAVIELDRCYPASTKTSEIFEDIGRTAVRHALNGHSGSLVVCGASCSGKTHSLLGHHDSEGSSLGLLPRIVGALQDTAVLRAGGPGAFTVALSIFEVHAGRITDLLCSGPGGRDIGATTTRTATMLSAEQRYEEEELKLVEDPLLGTYVPGLLVVPVDTFADLERLADFAMRRRVFASKDFNARGRRGSTVFVVQLEPKPSANSSSSSSSALQPKSRLDIIDLASLDRMPRFGSRFGWSSDPDLGSLRDVVAHCSVLPRPGSSTPIHPPPKLRGPCTLARLLRTSLTGEFGYSLTLLATLSPTHAAIPETLHTLQFAMGVREMRRLSVSNGAGKMAMEMLELCHNNSQNPSKCDEALAASTMKRVVAQIDRLKNLTSEGLAAMQKAALESLSSGMNLISELCAEDDEEPPSLQNISDDSHLSQSLMYFIRPGKAITVGSADGCGIHVSGVGVPPNATLCSLVTQRSDSCGGKAEQGAEEGSCGAGGSFELRVENPDGHRIYVNGRRVIDSAQLRHGDRLVLGRARVFQACVPPAFSENSNHNAEFDVRDFAECVREIEPDDASVVDRWRRLLLDSPHEDEQLKEDTSSTTTTDTTFATGILGVPQRRALELLEVLKEGQKALEEACEISASFGSQWHLSIDLRLDAALSEDCPAESAVIARVSKYPETGVIESLSYHELQGRVERLRDSHHERRQEKEPSSQQSLAKDEKDGNMASAAAPSAAVRRPKALPNESRRSTPLRTPKTLSALPPAASPGASPMRRMPTRGLMGDEPLARSLVGAATRQRQRRSSMGNAGGPGSPTPQTQTVSQLASLASYASQTTSLQWKGGVETATTVLPRRSLGPPQHSVNQIEASQAEEQEDGFADRGAADKLSEEIRSLQRRSATLESQQRDLEQRLREPARSPTWYLAPPQLKMSVSPPPLQLPRSVFSRQHEILRSNRSLPLFDHLPEMTQRFSSYEPTLYSSRLREFDAGDTASLVSGLSPCSRRTFSCLGHSPKGGDRLSRSVSQRSNWASSSCLTTPHRFVGASGAFSLPFEGSSTARRRVRSRTTVARPWPPRSSTARASWPPTCVSSQYINLVQWPYPYYGQLPYGAWPGYYGAWCPPPYAVAWPWGSQPYGLPWTWAYPPYGQQPYLQQYWPYSGLPMQPALQQAPPRQTTMMTANPGAFSQRSSVKSWHTRQGSPSPRAGRTLSSASTMASSRATLISDSKLRSTTNVERLISVPSTASLVRRRLSSGSLPRLASGSLQGGCTTSRSSTILYP